MVLSEKMILGTSETSEFQRISQLISSLLGVQVLASAVYDSSTSDVEEDLNTLITLLRLLIILNIYQCIISDDANIYNQNITLRYAHIIFVSVLWEVNTGN